MSSNISSKQIRANRKNAKRGGVKTKAGKETSKFNARKHGILSDEVLDNESELRDKLTEKLYAEFKPSSSMEVILVERLILIYLKLSRANQAEAEYLKDVFEHTGSFLVCFQPGDRKDGSYCTKDVEKLMSVYAKYESSLESRLFRTLKQLGCKPKGER